MQWSGARAAEKRQLGEYNALEFGVTIQRFADERSSLPLNFVNEVQARTATGLSGRAVH
jgi:hypothetical protein